VELLNPLAVQDVGLLTGDVLELAGIDQVDLEAAFFQQLVDRNPVDAGGFHGHHVYLAGGQPGGQSL
jgi:hypothetical protein